MLWSVRSHHFINSQHFYIQLHKRSRCGGCMCMMGRSVLIVEHLEVYQLLRDVSHSCLMSADVEANEPCKTWDKSDIVQFKSVQEEMQVTMKSDMTPCSFLFLLCRIYLKENVCFHLLWKCNNLVNLSTGFFSPDVMYLS